MAIAPVNKGKQNYTARISIYLPKTYPFGTTRGDDFSLFSSEDLMGMKSIAIIIPYFGKWPEWFSLTLESIRWNPTIDWFFITDCGLPERVPDNAHFHEVDFSEYCKQVSDKLNICFAPASPYKLCDLKPAYGHIHEDLIIGYDYWGYGDIDVIYGDIRSIYDNDLLLECHSCISVSDYYLAGYLAIFSRYYLMHFIPAYIHHTLIIRIFVQ